MTDPIRNVTPTTTATVEGHGVYNKGRGELRLYAFGSGVTLEALKHALEKRDYKDQFVFAAQDETGATRFYAVEADDVALDGKFLRNVKVKDQVQVGDLQGVVVFVNNERPEWIDGAVGVGKAGLGAALLTGALPAGAAATAAGGPMVGGAAAGVLGWQGIRLAVDGVTQAGRVGIATWKGTDKQANPVLAALAQPAAGGSVRVLANARQK